MAGGTRLPPRGVTQTYRTRSGLDTTRTFYTQDSFERYAWTGEEGFDFVSAMGALTPTAGGDAPAAAALLSVRC